MRISVDDLPDISKNRLLQAVAGQTRDTFVLQNSKRPWALAGTAAAMASLLYAIYAANDYRWASDQKVAILVFLASTFVVGNFGLLYLLRWYRSVFKDCTLLNPLYLLRFRLSEIAVFPLLATKEFKLDHLYNQQGVYQGAKFRFVFEGGSESFKIASAEQANELISALKRFRGIVAQAIEHQDAETIYSLDLLYEWRIREKQYPKAASRSRFGALAKRAVVPLFVALGSALLCFIVVDASNDYHDDEKRWHEASTKNTATGYRMYLASRPTGRHIGEAQSSIDQLYERAAYDYQAAAGFRTSDGVEAVIAVLNYAKRTGRYKVYVEFEGDTQIPSDIESRLQRDWGVSNIVPIQPSFAPSANSTRQARIIQRISTTFGRVIPGDILEFSPGQGSSRDVNFRVLYTVEASGHLYYRESQKHLPMARRDLYTGISFDWFFEVYVPGLEGEPFQFSLTSEPADLFRVAYTRYSMGDREPSAGQVYDAMADSAFDNFSARLFSEVSLPSYP